MREKFIAAIDQGTTSSRCIVFDRGGTIVTVAQREHRQILPYPNWVEHDADEIWANVEIVTREALAAAEIHSAHLAAVGITNQRETTLVWERDTGRPVRNAIVWQDTRTDVQLRRFDAAYGAENLRRRTGLPLAPYFAGSKLAWLLENVDGLYQRAVAGEVLFGTMDSWLIFKLTGRHMTDVTNASRTLLMNLHELRWDDEILAALDIPAAMLPEIRSSSEVYGTVKAEVAGGTLTGVPVASALGDQQAALFGQTCFTPGEAKCTYGTGSFLLVNTGTEPVASRHGLITTVGYRIGAEPAIYALEGSIAVTGALVQWLRDNLALIESAPEVEELARTVRDNGGCYFVPAFSGLFAPHWRSDARGVIVGLTSFVNRGHLARAALESTGWQTREVVDAMNNDSGVPLTTLRVDGGMTANTLLMQFLADVLNVPVVRPTVTETTCLGAAYAAGLAVGCWPDTDTLRANWRHDQQWRPSMDDTTVRAELRQWRKAVQRSLDWA